jgi:hypothetical protein
VSWVIFVATLLVHQTPAQTATSPFEKERLVIKTERDKAHLERQMIELEQKAAFANEPALYFQCAQHHQGLLF